MQERQVPEWESTHRMLGLREEPRVHGVESWLAR